MAYAYMMDAFTTFYGGDQAERIMFIDKVSGYYWRLLGDHPVQRARCRSCCGFGGCV